MTGQADITVRIDRLVLEADGPLDAFSFQRSFTAALRAIILERGLPDAWRHDQHAGSVVVDSLAWDGQGGEQDLARAVAAHLYDSAGR